MKLPPEFDDLVLTEILQLARKGRLPRELIELLAPARGRLYFFPEATRSTPGLTARLRGICEGFFRPTLLIQDNTLGVTPCTTWNRLIEQHRPVLTRVLQGIGCIQLEDPDGLTEVGTGFLADDRTVVTNRRVARLLRERPRRGLTWKVLRDPAGSGRDVFSQHAIVGVRHVEGHGGPDLALLRIEPSGEPPRPLELAEAAGERDVVAAIGYSGLERPSSREEEDGFRRVFGRVLDVKRFAPGVLHLVSRRQLTHDCATLDRSAGSPIIDLETGRVVAVHAQAGPEGNLAVPAAVLADTLAAVS